MDSASQRDTKCSLCFQTSNHSMERKNEIKSEHLATYLYHQNVREVHAAGVAMEGKKRALPQLTFALSVGGSQNIGTEGHGNRDTEANRQLCDACCMELKDLDKLHQELEGVKSIIEAKIGSVNSRRQRNGLDDAKSELLFRTAPNLQMSFGASVVGKDNILQTLKYLSGICEGLTSTLLQCQDKPLEEAGVDAVTPPQPQIGLRPFVCEVCFKGHYELSDFLHHRLVVHKIE